MVLSIDSNLDSDPIPNDEATKPEEVQVEDEEFGTLEESPISF